MWDIMKSPNFLSIGKDEGNDIEQREENIPHTKQRNTLIQNAHSPQNRPNQKRNPIQHYHS